MVTISIWMPWNCDLWLNRWFIGATWQHGNICMTRAYAESPTVTLQFIQSMTTKLYVVEPTDYVLSVSFGSVSALASHKRCAAAELLYSWSYVHRPTREIKPPHIVETIVIEIAGRSVSYQEEVERSFGSHSPWIDRHCIVCREENCSANRGLFIAHYTAEIPHKDGWGELWICGRGGGNRRQCKS